MATQVQYQYLEPRPHSHYRQLGVKGRHIRAEVLYQFTVGAESHTPEEVAQDYDLPVEAVQEAIDYAIRNQEVLEAERAREASRMQQLGLTQLPFVPAEHPTDACISTLARCSRTLWTASWGWRIPHETGTSRRGVQEWSVGGTDAPSPWSVPVPGSRSVVRLVQGALTRHF